MNTELDPSDETIPGTVFNSRQVRLLKIVVISMGVMLITGFVLIIATIVYQAMYAKQDDRVNSAVATGAERQHLSIESGAVVSDIILDGNRMAIHLNGHSGSEIVIISIKTGKVVRRIRLKSD
jgi:hypothetical protein